MLGMIIFSLAQGALVFVVTIKLSGMTVKVDYATM